MRVPTHDQRGVLRARQTGGIRAEAGPVDRDVQEQGSQDDRVPHEHVHRERVGEVRGVNIDVAAHREQRGDRRQTVENRKITDVPRVEDRVGRERCQVTERRRVRRGVGVGHDREAGGTVLTDANARAQLGPSFTEATPAS